MRKLSNNSNSNSNTYLTTNKVEKALGTLISNQMLGLLARRSGFKERSSEFQFAKFVRALICFFGESRLCTIQGLWTLYKQISGDDIQYKPFHNKIKKESSALYMMEVAKRLMNVVIGSCIDGKGQACLQLLRAHGLPINDIVCYDGTYWNVNEELADKYKGTRSASKPQPVDNTFDENGSQVYEKKPCAQVGLQTEYSVKRKSFIDIVQTAATADEADYVKVLLSDPQMYLMDAGYNKHKLLKWIDECDSYYITKANSNCAPKILRAYIDGKEVEWFKGHELNEHDVKTFRANSTVDLDVEFRDGLKARIVRFKGKDKKFTYILTNVKRHQLNATLVSDVYRLRWQIELQFKQLKSGNNLLGVNTTYDSIVQLFIMGALCSNLVKRIAIECLSRVMPDKSFSYYRTNVYCDWIGDFVKALFARSYEKLRDILKMLLDHNQCYLMAKQARSKHEQHKTMDSVIYNLALSLKEKGLKQTFLGA